MDVPKTLAAGIELIEFPFAAQPPRGGKGQALAVGLGHGEWEP
jgi:hypothetical protein